jgi:uncharacterized protein with von Willebrand factor type A (vWA) domain
VRPEYPVSLPCAELRTAVRKELQMGDESRQLVKARSAMDKESLEILEMVKEGRVTPEQATQLLEALRSQPSAVSLAAGERPRFVRVRVNVNERGGEGDQVAVNMNLPVAMADLALKLLQEAKITRDGETIEFGDYLKDLQGMDISAILQLVKEGAEGKLVDVDVADGDGDKVKVEVIVD